jgi:competence protein ComEC
MLRVVLHGNPPTLADGEEISFTARLITTPKEKTHTQQFSLKAPSGESIVIQTTKYPRYLYGQLLQVRGTVDHYVLDNGKILTTMSFPQIQIVQEDINFLFLSATWIRERIRETFSASLPPTGSSLLLGIVLGEKSLPDKFVKDLQATGLMHVVAASGMNVAIVAGFLMTFLNHYFNRSLAIKLSILGIAFYTIIAGLEPSIMRASIMAVITFSAYILGRQNTAFVTLFLTASLMLLLNPDLIEDIGFQLSFAATAGMIFLRPHLTVFKQKGKGSSKNLSFLIQDDLAATIAAQLTTVPLLLVYFHTYGLLSIVVNSFVLWTIPPLMIIGGVASLLGLILPPIGSFVALLSLPFLFYFETVVRIFAPITPIFSINFLPWPIILGYYILLIAFLIAKKHKTIIT